MQNLKEKTVKGIFWAVAERAGIRMAQLLPAVVLARLLTPEQFGLIGMLAIFIALAQTFLDSGFGAALIQKKEITYEDECTMFYFNIAIGGLMVGVLYVIAPWVAAFYQQPALDPLMRVLALDILLKSFCLIQTTLLTRALDFKALFKANVWASVGSGLVGIGAAILGWGVWSLVAQTMSGSLFRLFILWVVSPWRPALLFRLESLKSMFNYGSNMLLSSSLSTFFDNFYPIVIGKLFSISMVGLYTRADMLRQMIFEAISMALTKVLFPSMAAIQDDTARLQRAYRKFVVLATFAHFPLIAGVIVVARPLIVLLFSEQWLEAVPIFQLICISGLIYPLHLVNLNVLRAIGRADLFFRLTVVNRALMVMFIIILYRWGLYALLIGQITNSFIFYILNSYYSNQFIHYPITQQVRDFLPNLLCSAGMAAMMWLSGIFLPPNEWILLFTQSSIGVLAYLLLTWIFQKEILVEMFSIGKSLLKMRASLGTKSIS